MPWIALKKELVLGVIKGKEFTIEVKTTGKVHSLTTQDENKILRWLK